MNLEIKFIHVNGEKYLHEYTPEVKDNWICSIDLRIGPKGGSISSDYSLKICTPKRLEHIISKDQYFVGRHVLIFNCYDDQLIMNALQKLVESCARPTFDESLIVLARYFSWEFEDYNL